MKISMAVPQTAHVNKLQAGIYNFDHCLVEQLTQARSSRTQSHGDITHMNASGGPPGKRLFGEERSQQRNKAGHHVTGCLPGKQAESTAPRMQPLVTEEGWFPA